MANDYPLYLIRKWITLERDKLERKDTTTPREENERVFVGMTYIKGLSERIEKMFKPTPIKFGYRNLNSIGRSVYSRLKYKVEKNDKTDVVYRVPCLDCSTGSNEVNYIGTTYRKVRTRMDEHKKELRRGAENTGLSKHAKYTGHSFGLTDPCILEVERREQRRYMLESVHIAADPGCVNNIRDARGIDRYYGGILSHVFQMQSSSSDPGLRVMVRDPPIPP